MADPRIPEHLQARIDRAAFEQTEAHLAALSRMHATERAKVSPRSGVHTQPPTTVRAVVLVALCRVVSKAARRIEDADALLWAIERVHPSIVPDRAAQIERQKQRAERAETIGRMRPVPPL